MQSIRRATAQRPHPLPPFSATFPVAISIPTNNLHASRWTHTRATYAARVGGQACVPTVPLIYIHVVSLLFV